MVHYRNRGDHSLTIDLSNARKTIAKQHETFCGRTLLGRARSKEYLRKREEEGTKILSRREREREKRIELAKTNSVEVEAGARGKLAVWSREK